MKRALILMPHQLYDISCLPEVEVVYMVEEPLLFGTDKEFPVQMHVQKLVLHRASMRRYVEEVLWPAKIDVEYIEPDADYWSGKVLRLAAMEGATQIYIFDPTDDVLARRLNSTAKDLPHGVKVIWQESPNFYLSSYECKEYFKGKKKHLFADFYQHQRERFDILLTSKSKPIGGKWSFDDDNRKKLPGNVHPPALESYADNSYVSEAKAYVQARFNHHHGSIDNFIWPTNHQESRRWLETFVEERLDRFGPYQDAIEPAEPWVFHAVITPMLNIGLLDPKQIVDAVLRRHAQKPVELPSLEGFIGQVVGWREYMRGQYLHNHVGLRTSNYFNHTSRLTDDWYKGTTGLKPVDDAIKKADELGYLHHIERLMVVGNAMLLSRLHPDDVYRWFMEMTVDAYDWVMVPNVYGMSQFSDGGSLSTKPYISASSYICKMSHYDKHEDWTSVWDGLYWTFIDDNRRFFAHNRRMAMMVKLSDKLDESRLRVIRYKAQDFLATKTSQVEN